MIIKLMNESWEDHVSSLTPDAINSIECKLGNYLHVFGKYTGDWELS